MDIEELNALLYEDEEENEETRHAEDIHATRPTELYDMS